MTCFAALPKRRPLAYPCFYAALVCRTAFQKTLDTIKGGALNPSAPPDVAFIHLHNPYILKSFFRGSQLTLFNLFATSCQLNSAFLKKFCFPFNGLPFSPLINSKTDQKFTDCIFANVCLDFPASRAFLFGLEMFAHFRSQLYKPTQRKELSPVQSLCLHRFSVRKNLCLQMKLGNLPIRSPSVRP